MMIAEPEPPSRRGGGRRRRRAGPCGPPALRTGLLALRCTARLAAMTRKVRGGAAGPSLSTLPAAAPTVCPSNPLDQPPPTPPDSDSVGRSRRPWGDAPDRSLLGSPPVAPSPREPHRFACDVSYSPSPRAPPAESEKQTPLLCLCVSSAWPCRPEGPLRARKPSGPYRDCDRTHTGPAQDIRVPNAGLSPDMSVYPRT